MQSLKNRFNGNKEEVLLHIKRFGIDSAMDKYDVRSEITMRRWIYEETKDENFGRHPEFGRIDGFGRRSLLEQFVQKFADYVVRTEIRDRNKDERIAFLEKQLKYYREKEAGSTEVKLASIMEACES